MEQSDRKAWLILLVLAAAAAVISVLLAPDLIDRIRGRSEPEDRWHVEARREVVGRKLGERHPAGEVVLDEEDLRSLIIVSLADRPDGQRLLAITEEIEADVRNGGLRLGLLLDLSKAREAKLTDEQRETMQKAESLLALFGRGELVLAIEGKPTAEHGRIAFGPGTNVRLAFMEMTLPEFSERFGLKREQAAEGISFAVLDRRVVEVEVLDEALRLVLAAR